MIPSRLNLLAWLAVGLLCTPSFAQPNPDESTTELSPTEVMRAMMLTSKAFRQAADSIRPSLVTIESLGGVGAVQGRIGGIRKQGEGNSTGVVISPDGLVVTSTFNFIQQPPVITVITHDGERRLAKLLGRDDQRKICLLKIDGVSNLPVANITKVGKVTVGQWAVSVGVGYGDANPAISTGIISAKNRVGGKAIQTDANISPANYGGPLIGLDGGVIGICVPLNPQSSAIGAGVEWYDSGIGFAVPLDGNEQLIERLKKGERIQPAFVGIRYVPNAKGKGLLIEEVVPGTPAEKSGLEIGDRIIALDGQEVNDAMSMKQVLGRFEAGSDVDLTYIPSEKEEAKVIRLKLAAPPHPKGEQPPLEPPKIQ